MPRVSGQDGRAAILAAASRLFYEQGLEPVSIDMVAAAAGLTKRALYYHFPTKHDLVLAYLDAAGDIALVLLKKMAQTSGAPDAHPYARLLEGLRKWLKTRGFHGCVFLRAARSYPDDLQIGQISIRHKELTLAWLTVLARDAGGARPDDLALQFRLLLDGVFASDQLYDHDVLIDTAQRSLAALLAANTIKPNRKMRTS
ncbi:MAG: hypothetical protein A4S14_07370 [Proteobacteria bacterium SG_bin9]|nr:MAG: hypothetical protein A4S14_07370 [Proteobacteria bacterium SG_bin9]